MMRFNTFGRTVLFGAVAAAGWLPWMLVAGPMIGTPAARVIYLIATAAVYIAGLSSARYGLTLAAAAVVGAALVAMFAETTMSLVVILAVILGVTRSGFVYPATSYAVIREMIFLGGGLLLARFVAGAAVMPTSGALWAFFLVQALFFLTAGGDRRVLPDSRLDSFDAAYRRALSLLEEPDVAP